VINEATELKYPSEERQPLNTIALHSTTKVHHPAAAEHHCCLLSPSRTRKEYAQTSQAEEKKFC